jgi:hypothetical protein
MIKQTWITDQIKPLAQNQVVRIPVATLGIKTAEDLRNFLQFYE